MKLLEAWSFCLEPSYEIAIVGSEDHHKSDLVLTTYQKYIPNRVIAYLKTDGTSEYKGLIGLLEKKKSLKKKTTAYVCQNFTCLLPVTTKEDFLKNLKK